MSLKINDQIVALRKQKGVTQGELADVLGVSNQSVSKWESGQCCPDIQLLPELAKYFDVSIDELMGHETPKKETKGSYPQENDPIINDPLLNEAIELLGKKMLLSTAVLQRKLGVGYVKAKELIKAMQSQGYVVEIRPGFYQATRSQEDRVRVMAKDLARERADMLDVALAMHAAWFVKTQGGDTSVDSSMAAVLGGQWGYSAFSEPDMTTVMRGQSVFYSKNRSLDYNSDRIAKLSAKLRVLSDRKNLTILASLYALTVHSEDAYVGVDEISVESKLTKEEIEACLDGSLVFLVIERDRKYRIRGEDMAILPILSILCY
jgi:transcriptional regulator with XRE-family HTH domain